MQKVLAVLAFVFAVVLTSQAHADPPDPEVHTPRPPYPYAARVAGKQGSGGCKVIFDAKGRVATATMLESTGSQLLDENTLAWARANWFGPPGGKAVLPITYALASGGRPPVRAVGKYSTPAPPYPVVARREGLQGAGTVRVTFDVNGKASEAGMIKSTGSDILDENTINFCKANWRRLSPGAASAVWPVAYKLR